MSYKFKKKAAVFLGIPKESALNANRIVILNNEIYIENHKGIEHYSKEKLTVRVNGKLLNFEGTNLVIEHLKQKDIKITGEITGLQIEML